MAAFIARTVLQRRLSLKRQTVSKSSANRGTQMTESKRAQRERVAMQAMILRSPKDTASVAARALRRLGQPLRAYERTRLEEVVARHSALLAYHALTASQARAIADMVEGRPGNRRRDDESDHEVAVRVALASSDPGGQMSNCP